MFPGSSKLKWLVRGRDLILVVVAELWQGIRSENEIMDKAGDAQQVC